MSSISELRNRIGALESQVDELEGRFTLLENVVVKLIDEMKGAGGVKEHHSAQHNIGDVRPPIGYKR